MSDLPITTLFMLVSIDGKISTGSVEERDFDKDLSGIQDVGKGLHQYYDLEKQTDHYSFNTGRVLAKVGWNDEKETIKQIDVTFIVVDNKPHLTKRGVENLLKFVNKLYIVTTNKKHPAFTLQDDNLEIIHYETKIDFIDVFRKLKSFGVERITIQSGGEVNAELMRTGLIDLMSLVVAPIAIGGRKTSSLFDGRSLESDDDLTLIRPLTLIEVIKLDNSYLHIKYEVIK